jgi:hypothetical protein
MSAGGQRGVDLSGITASRIRDAADVTAQAKVRLVYQTLISNTNQRPYVGRIANGNNNLVQFTEGIKEISAGGSNCPQCVGLPFQLSVPMTFKNFL